MFTYLLGGIGAHELCESRGGRPGLQSLIGLRKPVDVKQHTQPAIGGMINTNRESCFTSHLITLLGLLRMKD